jgi:hypothetical protein
VKRLFALVVAAGALVLAPAVAVAATTPVIAFTYSSTATNKTVQAFPARATCHLKYIGVDPLPDPKCTPGALNPAVTQATLASTICKSGYTATIRPSTSITDKEKIASLASYGLPAKVTTEFDHFVPLELGGASNSAKNFWPEPNDRAKATNTVNGKDGVETSLKAAVCAHKVTLAAAQQAIATNWTTAKARVGLA